MRELAEIIKEIREEKWLFNKEKGMALAREYGQVYKKWESENQPDKTTKEHLQGIARRLGREVTLWLMEDSKS